MNWKATDTLRRKMLRPVFTETISWKAAFLWSLYLKSLCNRQNFKGQHSMTAVPICPQDMNTWVWGMVQGHSHRVSRPLVYLSGSLLTLQTSTVHRQFLREPFPGTDPWEATAWKAYSERLTMAPFMPLGLLTSGQRGPLSVPRPRPWVGCRHINCKANASDCFLNMFLCCGLSLPQHLPSLGRWGQVALVSA